jgi:YggT family protein
MTQALIFILKTLTHLYLLLLLLRFWLPVLRADFRNPVAQGVLRLTSPLIIPLRRFVPAIGRVDTATVLVAFTIEYLLIVLLLTLSGVTVAFVPIALTSVLDLAVLSLNMFFFVILIKIIMSWVAPHNYNPVTAMLTSLSEPILRPFRRLIPPIGGLDVSPILAIVLLQAGIIVLQTYKPLPI